MYWSSFSGEWYEVTCTDLGLEFVGKSKEVKDFIGEKETTIYLLFRKPLNYSKLLLEIQQAQQPLLTPMFTQSPHTPDMMQQYYAEWVTV